VTQNRIFVLFLKIKKIKADVKIGAGGDDNLGIYLLWPNQKKIIKTPAGLEPEIS
jgi:hypothetical protein